MSRSLNVCLATSELAPLAKTGGLADVSAALSMYLHRKRHKLRVLMPRYSRIDKAGVEVRNISKLRNLELNAGGYRLRYSIVKTILDGSRLPVYLVDCPPLFGRDAIYTNDGDEHLRFLLLSRAMLELCQHQQFAPDIMHCNDWQTALLPLYLKTIYAWDKLFARTRSVLTIHNIGYQGMFPASVLPELHLKDSAHTLHQDDLHNGVINFLKTGILYADLITTVSPTYAREIMGSEYGMGMEHLLRERRESVVGILNGVDYDEWNPETDSLIPHNYSADDLSGKRKCKTALLAELGLDPNPDRPLAGIVTRLAGQKGIDLIEAVMPQLLAHRDFAFVALGNGEPQYERMLAHLQAMFPRRVCYYRGYNNRLAHWIEAGADFFLMPSRYEPCGLNQMYSLRYGTVPVVRETGGLADSVEQVDPDAGTGTGILFRDYDNGGLWWAVTTALDLYSNPALWRRIMLNGMARDFSWDAQGAQYTDLYRRLSNR